VIGISHHTEAPSGSPVFSIASAGAPLREYPAHFVLLMQEERGTVGFGAGGGAGVCVFRGGLKTCLPQAMEFEETKPRINADEPQIKGYV